MSVLIDYKRVVLIIILSVILLVGAVTFISYACGPLVLTLIYNILSIGLYKNEILDFLFGLHLSDEHKLNLQRIRNSKLFILVMVFINIGLWGLTIYAFILLGGTNLMSVFR